MREEANTWKVVWDAYFQYSSKWAYAYELWRVAGGWLRAWLVAAILLVAVVFISAPKPGSASDEWWTVLVVFSEGLLVLALDRMKSGAFTQVYGSGAGSISPAEDEGFRRSRFLIFRKKLTEASVDDVSVSALFDILEAKIDLENYRNDRLNRFLVFVSGIFAALLVAGIRGLEPTSSIYAVIWLLLAALFLAPVFWLFPSRKEKLKELKYFMHLYSKSAQSR